MIRRHLFLGLAVLALGGSLLGCGGGNARSGHVRLFLNWFPEHEHGGYFAAAAAGLWRDRGVDMEILPGGPQAPVIARVASGDVEFGVLNADDVVLARAAGAPLVALLAPLQTNPACIMVHRASGIEHLGELRDLTIGIQVAAANYRWLARRLSLTNVTVVPYPGTIAEFLVNPHYAQQAYAFSEPLLAEAQGGDPRCLLIAESGFDPYASVLVTREALVRDRPDLVRAVTVGAALGWRQYLTDPAPANALILAANPALGAEVVARGARVLAPLARGPATRVVGAMTAERWTTLVTQLSELGLLETVPSADALWNGSFVPTE